MKYKCPLNDINTAEVPQTSSHSLAWNTYIIISH